MSGYQQVTLVGNVGTAPEMRYTPSGVAVTSFSFAVNRDWTDAASGEKKSKTLWFRINAWRKQAEIVGQYVTTGKQLLVIGELEEPKAYTAKDGSQRASLEVTAQTIKFLGAKGEATTDDGGATAMAERTANAPQVTDDSIPF